MVSIRLGAAGLRVYGANYAWSERIYQADVDLAYDLLECHEGQVGGTVASLRARWSAVLNDLYPATPKGLVGKLLHKAGFSLLARATDAAIWTLFGSIPYGNSTITLRCEGVGEEGRMLPEDSLRKCLADALDDAYRILLPHETIRQAHEHREFSHYKTDGDDEP